MSKETRLEIEWEKLPEWANYVAMDRNGDWWCYDLKPKKMLNRTWRAGKKGKGRAVVWHGVTVEIDCNWNKSLRKRPERTSGKARPETSDAIGWLSALDIDEIIECDMVEFEPEMVRLLQNDVRTLGYNLEEAQLWSSIRGNEAATFGKFVESGPEILAAYHKWLRESVEEGGVEDKPDMPAPF